MPMKPVQTCLFDCGTQFLKHLLPPTLPLKFPKNLKEQQYYDSKQVFLFFALRIPAVSYSEAGIMQIESKNLT
jgi:hypothetical protein